MSPIKDVTGTAFVVAEFRARENEEPHPLYVDRSSRSFSMSGRKLRPTRSRPASPRRK